MATSVETRVRGVVADVFGLPLSTVTRDTSHEQVETWDSLNIVHLLLALQEEFEVSISPDEAVQFLSVSNIVTVIELKDATFA